MRLICLVVFSGLCGIFPTWGMMNEEGKFDGGSKPITVPASFVHTLTGKVSPSLLDVYEKMAEKSKGLKVLPWDLKDIKTLKKRYPGKFGVAFAQEDFGDGLEEMVEISFSFGGDGITLSKELTFLKPPCNHGVFSKGKEAKESLALIKQALDVEARADTLPAAPIHSCDQPDSSSKMFEYRVMFNGLKTMMKETGVAPFDEFFSLANVYPDVFSYSETRVHFPVPSIMGTFTMHDQTRGGAAEQTIVVSRPVSGQLSAHQSQEFEDDLKEATDTPPFQRADTPYPEHHVLQQEIDEIGGDGAMGSEEEMDIEDLAAPSDSEEDDELRRIFQERDIFS